ncbi:elongation factor G [Clostridium sp. D2Q-11]|uniref:Elongation factor G n=1 Tax=Anaeromonas frigoriresistens TaxID=2683708 RepID=A0A942USZ7_9FIRM|nr:elongation factor G [Anaeromonas frigoriresistens]MBS4536845.1 elongation factor G [Anaeromonas frigoriresistens]
MNNYNADKIRNIAFLGHHGSGKTTLTETMLMTAGLIKRCGKVEDGNTLSDYDKEEKSRQVSIYTSLIPIEWKEHKYNILDTPGYFDFVGEVHSALRVARGAVIVVDASSGIEVGTEKAWTLTRKRDIPTILYINKMDKENINYDKLVNELREKFGKAIIPFHIPIGKEGDFKGFVNIVDMKARIYDGKTCKDAEIWPEKEVKMGNYRDMLIESVAESDDELLEKYFEGEEFTEEEIHKALRNGVIEGKLIPVLCGSSNLNVGTETLLDMMWDYLPSPKDLQKPHGINPNTEEKIERNIEPTDPFSAIIFKTIADPYIGKISLFQVRSGVIRKEDEVYNPNTDEMERIGHLFLLRGKEQIEVNELQAGDIGAVSKLNNTHTGDTLCDKNNPIKYRPIPFPEPTLFMAGKPVTKNDEEKIGPALHKLLDEDKTFSVTRNNETKELLIGGQGITQLDVIKTKLKNVFGVNIDLSDPKIAYRETIKGDCTVQGKHKKQSGGAGQYGDVIIKFESSTDEFEFKEEVFGGSVPRQYIPAVEKGLREAISKGVLAGYPVVNLRATLLDGSYHPVDSSEMAFKIAASLAFKKGLKEAKPVLLEPIMKVEITIPDEYMGDIMGDMNKRRGRILGMEPQQDGTQLVIAEAPQSEMFKYTIDLKSMTQARGSFVMEFARYEEVPSNLSEKIIANAVNA